MKGIITASFDSNNPVDIATLPHENIWIRVSGSDDSEIAKLLQSFDIHALSIEDVINDEHQTKYENLENYSLIILKTFHNSPPDIDYSQLSIVWGRNFVISIEKPDSRLFSSYQDGEVEVSFEKLIYTMLDRVVDHYLDFISAYRSCVDKLEDEEFDTKDGYDLDSIFGLRRSIHSFRRMVRPVQEVVDKIMKPEGRRFSNAMMPYLRDLYEHAARVNQGADALFETLNALQNEILTKLQYKLSRTMNVMTAASVIFLPIMAITGLYGMNFENMPIQNVNHGYYIVVGIILLIVAVIGYLFYRYKVFKD